jgi:hypothetical protein
MLLPTSKGGLTPAGTFWLFTAITLLGGAWAWCFIPETAGLSLEQMDYLFKLKWYRVGIWGRKDAERQVAIDTERWHAGTEKPGANEVEVVQSQDVEKRG